MKRNRHELGFSAYLLLLCIAIVAVIGSTGWYTISRHRIETKNSTYVAGYISVSFKDGVTFQRVLDLSKSYGLSDVQSIAGSAEFTPTSYRSISPTQFASMQEKLTAYPEVVSFFDDSADPSNNRAQAGEMWVKLTYAQSTTCARIKSITTQSGLGAPTQECPTATRIVTIQVPKGQENGYIRTFEQSALVQSAERMTSQLAT